jgi:RTX calcium-binding nonapeptide repeat (4 copies)/Right handed beta helix region
VDGCVKGDLSSADTIAFDIPGSGVRTISPTSQLPAVQGPVTIDGYSQDGASPNTLARGSNAILLIELNGQNAGTASGLQIVSNVNSVVKGLAINRFSGAGVAIGNNTTNTAVIRVEGNFIGTDPGGTLDRGNATGVNIFGPGTSGNVVGGLSPAARNLISGNGSDGVRIGRGRENRVEGNVIGTTKDGTGPLPNDGSGVFVNQGASDNRVGVFVPTPLTVPSSGANTIAFNRADGVRVRDDDSVGNTVLNNSIFSNDGLGIDLSRDPSAGDGVTANDEDDPDAGPNGLQNFPAIASAERGSLSVEGSLNSAPNTAFRIEFFANEECDPAGNGEGQTFFGATDVTTDAGGDASFDRTFFSDPPGSFVTATATRIDSSSGFAIPKDTSEFSGCREIQAPPPVCTITGTEGDDVIEASQSPGSDTICGLGGDDRINAGGGNDVVRGASGTDTLVGARGSDRLFGEADDDILNTRDRVRRNDFADGGEGTDSCKRDRGDRRVGCP